MDKHFRYLKWRVNPEPYFRLFWGDGETPLHKPYTYSFFVGEDSFLIQFFIESDAEEDEPSDASQSLPSPSHLIRAICTDAPGPPASCDAASSSFSGDEDIEEENQLKFSVEVVDVDKKNDLDVSPVPSRLDVHFRDEHSVSEVPSMTSGSMDDSPSKDKTHSDAKDQLGDGEYSGEWSVQDHSAGEALLGHAAQNQSAGAEGGDKAEGNDQEIHSEDAKDDLDDGEYSGEWSIEDHSAGEALLGHAAQNQSAGAEGGDKAEGNDQEIHSEDAKDDLDDGEYSGEWSVEDHTAGEALLGHTAQNQSGGAEGGDKAEGNDQEIHSEDAKDDLDDGEYSGEWSVEDHSAGEALLGHAAQNQSAGAEGGDKAEGNDQEAHSEDAKDDLDDGEYSGEWSVEDHSAGEALLGHAAQNQSAGAEGGDKAEGNDQEAHSEDAEDDLDDGEYSGEWSVEDQSAGEALLGHAAQNQPARAEGGDQAEGNDQEAHSEDAKDDLGDGEYSGEWSVEDQSAGEALLGHAAQNQPARAEGGDQAEGNDQEAHSEDAKDDLGDGEYSGEWSVEDQSAGEALLGHAAQNQPARAEGGDQAEGNDQEAHSEDAKDDLDDGEYSGEWSVEDQSAGEALLGHAAQNQPARAEGGDQAEGNDQEAHSEDAKDDLDDGEYSGEWSVEDQSVGEGLLNHAVQSREAESGGGSSSHREVIDQEGPVKFTVEVVNADKLADNSHAPDSPPPDSPQQLSVSEAMPSMTSGSMDDPFLAGLGDDPFLAVLDTNQRVEENSAEQDELGDGDYSGEWSSEGPELVEQSWCLY